METTRKSLYITPHTVVSREAIEADTDRIIDDAIKMFETATNPPKGYSAAMSISHAQITDKDPLRFFVTGDGDLIINPVFTNKTRHTVEKWEYCAHFPAKQIQNFRKKRHHKCEVEYWTILNEEKKEWVKKTESLSSTRAQLFQHEIDHMNGEFLQK